MVSFSLVGKNAAQADDDHSKTCHGMDNTSAVTVPV